MTAAIWSALAWCRGLQWWKSPARSSKNLRGEGPFDLRVEAGQFKGEEHSRWREALVDGWNEAIGKLNAEIVAVPFSLATIPLQCGCFV